MDPEREGGLAESSQQSGELPGADTEAYFAYAPPERRRRRVAPWWIAAVVAIVAAGIVGGFVHVSANRSYDEAAAALESATEDAREADAGVTVVVDHAADAIEASAGIIESAPDDLVDVAARTAFAEAAAVTQIALDAAAEPLGVDVPTEPPAKPLWTWDLLAAPPRFEEKTADLSDLSVELDAAETEIEGAEAGLLASAMALYASVAPAAAAVEAANVSAVNYVVLDFRDARDAVVGQTMIGSGAVDAFRTYAEKASTLKASSQTELAEKAGPLFDTRLEIEAFARSIAGGVVLDFDWAPIVNNIGGEEGMGGTATWVTDRGGFSTITLSNSVAENWPSADAQALVAHEVGHAITAKCSGMFDSASAPANEQWATAWAISMGHTAEGNGVQAYGYPPAEMIDAAATCR